MFAVRELLLDHFLTLDRLQVLEEVAECDEKLTFTPLEGNSPQTYHETCFST
jgi:hypothetical protein